MKLIIAQFTTCIYFTGGAWFSILCRKGKHDLIYSKMGFKRL